MKTYSEEADLRGLRLTSLTYTHPKARTQFLQLAAALNQDHIKGVTNCHFRVFEAYRTPHRQKDLFDSQKGVTGADQYQSAHQFGLAVDFVPQVDGVWSWDASLPWDHLAKRAKDYGLTRPLSWDLAHIEHPYWADLRDTMRRL